MYSTTWYENYKKNGITAAEPTRPDIKPFEFSQETLMGPQYSRSLGETLAQSGFEKAQRSFGLGNAANTYADLYNQYNQNRMGAYAQAGKRQLEVDLARKSAWKDYNDFLTSLYDIDMNKQVRGTGIGSISIRGSSGGGGGAGYYPLGYNRNPSGGYTKDNYVQTSTYGGGFV